MLFSLEFDKKWSYIIGFVICFLSFGLFGFINKDSAFLGLMPFVLGIAGGFLVYFCFNKHYEKQDSINNNGGVEVKELNTIEEKCTVTVTVTEVKTFKVDTEKFPYQKDWIGKGVGDIVTTRLGEQCKIEKIVEGDYPPPPPPPDPRKEEAKKLEDLLNGRITGRTITRDYGYVKDGLQRGKMYKKRALYLYEDGVNYLGFNQHNSGEFDLQKILFAENSTKEGYAVWMLPHSDLTGDVNDKCRWINVINEDKNEIIQYVLEGEQSSRYKRVTFVKQKGKSGEYVFLGVYVLEKSIMDYFKDCEFPMDSRIKNCLVKEVFTLVSEDYPEKK